MCVFNFLLSEKEIKEMILLKHAKKASVITDKGTKKKKGFKGEIFIVILTKLSNVGGNGDIYLN